MVAQFHEAAEELIGAKGATSAVAAALAYIAGAKDIISRSLLSAHQVCRNNNIIMCMYTCIYMYMHVHACILQWWLL